MLMRTKLRIIRHAERPSLRSNAGGVREAGLADRNDLTVKGPPVHPLPPRAIRPGPPFRGRFSPPTATDEAPSPARGRGDRSEGGGGGLNCSPAASKAGC